MRRRDALRLAGTAAIAPAALPTGVRAQTRDELKRREKEAVARSVAAEQTTAVAFEAIANGGVLDQRTTATMRVLLDHASAHAELLAAAFHDELEATPPLAPRRNSIPGLAHIRGQRGALALAAGLLDRALAAHAETVQATHNAQLLKAIAGIAGSDGQGLVLLRRLLGRPAVPSAFERGRA